MELSTNQIKAVRTALKRASNLTATSEQIKTVALNFSEFDSKLIAEQVEKILQSSALASSNNSDITFTNVENMNTNTELTRFEKQEIVSNQAIELGIELTEIETLEIVNSYDAPNDDTIHFLTFVRDTLQSQQIEKAQKQQVIKNLVGEISEIVKESQKERDSIIQESNQALKEIVDQCKRCSAEYKNPYLGRIEKLRELLQARTNN